MFQYDIEQLKKERILYAESFLKERGLTRSELLLAFRHQTESLAHLLLTSSPVHGLANKDSDIDFICVTDQIYLNDHMSVQYFIRDNHIELTGFSQIELNDSIYFLEYLAHIPFLESMLEIDNWKKSSVLSKKYLERVINGVDIDNDCPYIDHYKSLALVWLRQSFYVFRKCIICLILAERAGETRGKIAYGINGLLHLMDAFVSSSNNVFNNKKRYLQRYVEFCKNSEISTEFQKLSTKLNMVYNDLMRFNSDDKFEKEFYDLYVKAKDLLEIKFDEPHLFNVNIEKYIIHKGAVLLSSGDRTYPMQDINIGINKMMFDDLFLLDGREAAYVLSTLRAGVIVFNMKY